jgi:hypothetical protein
MRDWKRDYELQKKRGDTKGQLERQKARRLLDKTGADKNSNGKADKREGRTLTTRPPSPRAASQPRETSDCALVQLTAKITRNN